jgi:hypothetical protein
LTASVSADLSETTTRVRISPRVSSGSDSSGESPVPDDIPPGSEAWLRAPDSFTSRSSVMKEPESSDGSNARSSS